MGVSSYLGKYLALTGLIHRKPHALFATSVTLHELKTALFEMWTCNLARQPGATFNNCRIPSVTCCDRFGDGYIAWLDVMCRFIDWMSSMYVSCLSQLIQKLPDF